MYPSPSTIVDETLPPCVAPIPLSPTLCIPSMKISSPTANGCSSNPFIGVSRKQVTTPELLVITELIPTPFELFIATTLCTTESNPYIGDITLTSDTFWFGAIACRETSSTTVFVTGLNKIRLGAFVYSDPPLNTSTDSITSRLSILTTEGINASGLRVLSEEYS